MRYLNKIVFINSANIRYAEINLDGNVHFIGTQGVGKSTILRAILFFYNANKQKLGIRTMAGQKPFDEFYLGHPDSYIIYEVTRENGRFFIMAFLSQGRAAFRFVDCPYDKQFFIDDDGNVGYEWGKISQTIGARVFKSNIIRTREDYLHILYGNSQAVGRELRRFSIMESAKYQNVPRTIQNIFLNQSLESQVIKDIIIDSMDFTEAGVIDLNRIRDEVKDFRMQYDDISKWFRKEKDGSVKVRKEADRVLSTYADYEACRKMIAELTGQTVFALERDQKELPEVDSKISETKLLLAKKRRDAAEESNKYNKQRDELNQQLGVLKKVLDDTTAKRKHYDDIDIDSIIEKINHEGELNIRQQSLAVQMARLTEKNKDVKVKYDAMRQNEANMRKQRELDVQRRQSEQQVKKASEIGALTDKYNTDYKRISEDFQNRMGELQERRAGIQQEVTDLQVNAERIKNANPYSSQMDEEKTRIEKLRAESARLQKESARLQREIGDITHTTELQRKDMEAKADIDIKEIEHQTASLNEQMANLQQLLDRQKGSLIEWLGENKRGWEKNIGKVLDEESVLYNTALHPEIVSEGKDSVFGVKIAVDNIERTVRTPSDIQKEKTALDAKIVALRNDVVSRKKQLASDIELMEKKPGNKLRQLRADKSNIDAEAQSIPMRLKSAEGHLAQYNETLQNYRRQKLDENTRLLDDANERLRKAENNIKQAESDREKELDALRKAFNHSHKEVEARYASVQKALEDELKEIAIESEKRLKEFDALMDRELHGLGVDTNQLVSLRTQLNDIEAQLQFIDRNRKEYILWQEDKKEFFDHEQENKDKRKALKVKLDDLDDKFAVRRRKLDDAIKMVDEECRRLIASKLAMEQAIHETEGFMASESWPTDFADTPVETVKPLSEILTELKNRVMEQNKYRDSFQGAVKKFKANFSPQNTFHFRTDFETERDFTDFAANLYEFISNDKIETYRQRVSEQYASILRTIGHSIGELMSNKSQVQGTINEINRDFRENNFVGVVKDIELRISDSSDRLVQHLLSIKSFNDEHANNIGEMDLFTDETQRVQNNQRAVQLISVLIDQLEADQKRDAVTLADIFKLEFRVRENDNDTNWVERLSNVGSDGTDVLVKAMVNIMLINVFKKKVSKRFGDFRIHCMMDEIGKLHPDNVAGILDFANKRNIYLVNSSPTTYNATAYKYTYSLSKDVNNVTVVKTLMTIL